MSAELYRTAMRTIRRFEGSAWSSWSTRMKIAGVTHEYVGQEAVATGVCAALTPNDVITSTHRGHGHVIAIKGADVRRMMAELLGRVDGLNRGRGGSMHIADLSVGILRRKRDRRGRVSPFAAGAAWAGIKTEGSGKVAAATFFSVTAGLTKECCTSR